MVQVNIADVLTREVEIGASDAHLMVFRRFCPGIRMRFWSDH